MAEYDWLGLTRRICVVTGAASGIGQASATLLARAGARLVLLDRDAAACQATADTLRAGGAEVLAMTVDVTDQEALEAASAHAMHDMGPAEVLVNNAGIIRPGSLEASTLADWHAVMAVDLTSYLLCARAFGRAMLARKSGALVHISSIAGLHPQPFTGSYSVAKSGVIMLSRQLAAEWGPSGVRSNVVCPGLVRTPMTEPMYQQPGVTERRAALIPLGRIATAEDIAKVVLFLASDLAAYVNGEEISVDGGLDGALLGQVPRPGFEA